MKLNFLQSKKNKNQDLSCFDELSRSCIHTHTPKLRVKKTQLHEYIEGTPVTTTGRNLIRNENTDLLDIYVQFSMSSVYLVAATCDRLTWRDDLSRCTSHPTRWNTHDSDASSFSSLSLLFGVEEEEDGV